MENYFPLALRLQDRKTVIIGGGREAERKIQSLLPCGPQLKVISPEATEEIAGLAAQGRLTWEKRCYKDGDLEGAFMVIVCAPQVGPQVKQEADQKGVLINVLDQVELCDFIAMATFSRGALQVAVHTSGHSAALSRRIRERLQGEFGPEYAELTELLGVLRPQVKEIIADPAERRRFWLEAITVELLQKIEEGFRLEELKEEILRRARRHPHSPSRPD